MCVDRGLAERTLSVLRCVTSSGYLIPLVRKGLPAGNH